MLCHMRTLGSGGAAVRRHSMYRRDVIAGAWMSMAAAAVRLVAERQQEEATGERSTAQDSANER